ncbi:glycosyltransferase family 39 protein [Roseimaritima sediminicola]|uniref:glycosyltransferase family 39 protein n=1 Tax=Roseimaritima sediminicola TaxID=2662066 RepID=UPI001298388A|nr:glycosyltransferase family 39 protein [Roseimaritima sediminicola]
MDLVAGILDMFHLYRRRSIHLFMLIAVHACLLGYGAWVHGPGVDEVGHLPAGLSFWQTGDTTLYRVNPPLARVVATWPLSLCEWPRIDAKTAEGSTERPEFFAGSMLWTRYGRDAFWYLTVARLASVLWSVLALTVIFVWGNRLYQGGAGTFCAAIWSFSPLVLTNAQMITPDTCAAALGLCAVYGFLNWLRKPCLLATYLAGLLLGLAELSKFTWVILPGVWVMLWTATCFRRRKELSKKEVLRQTFLLVILHAIALAVLNLGYGFEGTLTRLGGHKFVSASLRGNAADGHYGNRFSSSIIGAVPTPLPSNYVLGIDRQKLDFEGGYKSYLRGKWRNRGWWYYYAYGMLVKEPLGFVVLFLAAIAITIRSKLSSEEVVLLAPSAVLFLLVSSQTGFNHHLRYVLPAYPMVIVWMGKVWQYCGNRQKLRYAVLCLVLFSISRSMWVYPHSHAFFSLLIGGSHYGQYHLSDSNIDWGQDILLLSRWSASNPDKPLDGIAYSLDLLDLSRLGLTKEKPPRGYVASADALSSEGLDRTKFGPKPGRYAIFARNLIEHSSGYEYFREFEVKEILGYTIYIYELNEQDVANYWERRLTQKQENVPDID